jgi:23S rRNA pseudouridine2605 synthase
MLLRDYLQTNHWISRRKIVDLIKQWNVFLNEKKIESYKQEINKNDSLKISLLKIDEIINFEHKENIPELLAFNKPRWYTCSKSDPHNKTFYEILPNEFKNRYYYIWRLDKDSHWLMLLTSNPKLVHEFEHPSKEILKTYIIVLNKPFNRNLKEKILNGIHEWWELLWTKEIKEQEGWKIEITLNEGKKRHIRRIFKSLQYEVVDLQRISIWKYKLWNLKEGEYKII